MALNVKAIMERAHREVFERGFSNEDEIPVGEAILTLGDFTRLVRLYAEEDSQDAGLLDRSAEMLKKMEYPSIDIPQSQMVEGMGAVLGEDLATSLRYLMQVLPSIAVHKTEAGECSFAYALKYVLPSGEAFHLATVVKYFDIDEVGILSKEEVEGFKDNSALALDLYKRALGVRGLADKYFGRQARPFPDPI